MAPLILLKVPGIPGSTIEGYAPQALIYGWLLQFGFAVVPYFFMWLFLPENEARLGGTRFSLLAVNLGSALLWAGIFFEANREPLYAAGYLLWADGDAADPGRPVAHNAVGINGAERGFTERADC